MAALRRSSSSFSHAGLTRLDAAQSVDQGLPFARCVRSVFGQYRVLPANL